MSQFAPHTWNNEQWVIDRLADAIEQDDADAKATQFGREQGACAAVLLT